ncbi:MAG: hypothetical protein ACQES5_11985 [Thermodesulfobacteriota bacterium]
MVAELKDLVDKKCQQNKLEKIERRILNAMAVIVLSVVSLIFQGIEIFVFDFPPAAATNKTLHLPALPLRGWAPTELGR